MGRLLRIIRITVALAVFTLITGALTAAGMTVPAVADFLCRIQLIPAAMTFSMGIFIVWMLVTLIFGRIYCSTVCPIGTLQDIVARSVRLSKNSRRRPYRYSPALNTLRYVSLTVIFASLMCGFTQLLTLVDPYAIYDRFCSSILRPVFTVAAGSLSGAIISLTVISIISWLAARNGRTFCNTICPAGTTLGFPAKYSIFHIDIDPDKCIQCRRCESVCKAACIDVPAHTVDTSRCVTCFDCTTDCPNDAIRYTWTRHRLSYPLLQSIDGAVASATRPDTKPQSVIRVRSPISVKSGAVSL